jgi:predicted NUDIX family NTP pyrophosphohydrolase
MKQSAGILIYRGRGKTLEVLLAHPGGPFWQNKDEGAWTIPKGELSDGEDYLAGAIRETREELGIDLTGRDFISLGSVKLKSGKLIHAFAVEMDVDPATIESNEFEVEWPPRSGKRQSFPEIDRADWFSIDNALLKINLGQAGLVKALVQKLAT